MSADWTGAPNVHIGDPDRASRRDVAAFDLATGRSRRCGAGVASLAGTVNGVTERAEIRITAAG
ncbi:hypothetical protein [Streptomyces niveus]|uniref:hypothetical protein n=1 Tax=Streptomyces niveus TaxID=193462 RepID=UPI00342C4F1F